MGQYSTGAILDSIGGQVQSAVDVAAAVDRIEAALASNGGDSVLVDSNNALDVSAATVQTDLTDQSGRNMGKLRLMNSSEVLIDPATETTLASIAGALDSNSTDSVLVDSASALDASAAALEIGAWTAGTLTVTDGGSFNIAGTVATEQQTPVGVEDSVGTQVDPAQNVDGGSVSDSTTSTGSGSAAAVSIPDGRTTVTAAWDVSGAATITVEVSPDGGSTWYQEYSASPGSAETGTTTFTTGFDDARIYVDANLNSASIGAKGS